jgi:EAL domain-containing protein (putative c-di-GMP-specific phosphodiesterase class I)
MSGQPAGNAGLLPGLAARLQVDVVVYVSASGRASVLIGADRDEEVHRAERTGRDWLAGRTERRDVATWHPRESGSESVTPIHAIRGEILGVIVALRREPWSPHDLELFQFAVRSRAIDFDDNAYEVATSDAFARDLAAAIEHDELRLVFQPEYELSTMTVAAVEALVRWEHPEFGELWPESFIATAERSDAIHALGEWVIDRALRAFAEWRAAGLGDRLTLRMNVSPVQLERGDLEDLVAASLARYDVPGKQVCVELTENMPLLDTTAVAAALRRLKSLGVSLAIDDLATGYSTLSNLRLLPFDVIKIDRTLVTGIDHDVRAQIIMTAIIGLATSFEVDVVAEGVENEAELATLLDLGCSRAQGHHLGKPVAANAIRDLLSDRSHTDHVARETH